MAKKLLSRSIWDKSWYRRVGKTGGGVTWRNRTTGQVRKGSPSGKVLGFEKTSEHNYGGKGMSRAKVKQAHKLFGTKGIRSGRGRR